jgi:hypothetical protein
MARRIQGCGVMVSTLQQRAPLDIVIPTTSSVPLCSSEETGFQVEQRNWDEEIEGRKRRLR